MSEIRGQEGTEVGRRRSEVGGRRTEGHPANLPAHKSSRNCFQYMAWNLSSLVSIFLLPWAQKEKTIFWITNSAS